MNDQYIGLIQDPQALLAAIVASTDDVVVSKTLDGIITSWNPAAEKLFGYTAAEAVGRSIKFIIPPELHGEEDEFMRRLRAGERVQHYETVRVTRDGRRLDFSLTLSPLRDSSGNVVGASKVGRDITARKASRDEAESARQILQLISDNAPSLVGYADRDCIYRLAGRRHEQFLGKPRSMIVGRHAREVVGEAAWERVRDKVEEAMRGQPVSFEMEVPLPDVGSHWLNVSYIPHFDTREQLVGFAVFTTDVDERRRSEDAHRLLVNLQDATRGVDDPREVMLRTVTQVGRHYSALRCAYGEVDTEAGVVDLIRGYMDGVPSVAGRYPLTRFGAGLAEELLAGRVVAINDVSRDPRTADSGAQATFEMMQVRSVIVAPIVRARRTVAILSVADRAPRIWSRHQIDLLEHIAQRTFFAMESARALAELRQSEQVLSLASRAGRLGVWKLDLRADDVWWSVEMEELFGLPPGGFRALGGSEAAFYELVHPDDRARLAADIAEALDQQMDYRTDFRFRHASGEWRWMEGRGQGFYNERGDLETLYGIGIDVTDRKRDEEKLRQQATELAEADRRKDEFSRCSRTNCAIRWHRSAMRCITSS
jgi:PAS domain S-box-containing protein